MINDKKLVNKIVDVVYYYAISGLFFFKTILLQVLCCDYALTYIVYIIAFVHFVIASSKLQKLKYYETNN